MFTRFKFLTRRLRVTFHMKCGTALKIKCDKISIKKDCDNRLIGYHMEGGGNEAKYIRLNDVSAIMVKQ